MLSQMNSKISGLPTTDMYFLPLGVPDQQVALLQVAIQGPRTLPSGLHCPHLMAPCVKLVEGKECVGCRWAQSGAHHPYITVQNLVPWPLPSAREMGSVVQQCHLEEEGLCGGNSARSSHTSG